MMGEAACPTASLGLLMIAPANCVVVVPGPAALLRIAPTDGTLNVVKLLFGTPAPLGVATLTWEMPYCVPPTEVDPRAPALAGSTTIGGVEAAAATGCSTRAALISQASKCLNIAFIRPSPFIHPGMPAQAPSPPRASKIHPGLRGKDPSLRRQRASL